MKIIRGCKSIIQKLVFSSPKKSALVIYDHASLPGLDCVIKEFKYSVLETRNEKIYFSFLMLFYMIVNLKYCTVKIGRLNLKGIYLLSCLKIINPKVVITIVDDSEHFHWLSRTLKFIEFYAVENGIRPLGTTGKLGTESIRKNAIISFTNYICYGQYEVEHFPAQGHKIDHYYPFGPVPQSYYRSSIIAKHSKSIKYQICKVAQASWSVFEVHPDYPEKFKKLIITLEKYLAKFIKEFNIKCCIALRDSDDYAMNYYNEIYGNAVTYIQFEQHVSTYLAMEESEVVVNSFSSVGTQALGLGRKVLFVDCSGTPCHNFFKSSVTRFPEVEELCVVSEDNYELFCNKLNRLLAMPYEEYLSIVKEARAYYAVFDDHYPAYKKVIDLINQRINKKSQLGLT
ncbi:MAG: hypothetical protein A3E87_05095 [Gammaproteobacteria bacterium RIFCSPHIGHO2_12_FULL_35_23]|nr:MAG: hypothetical protein A3E87_05095 [Gammaproteobacteria bacterium RIFCSPHIGHO2_12_FULL_35_23]